jgi:hypothetical protein
MHYVTAASFQILSNSSFIYLSTIQRYTVSAMDMAVKQREQETLMLTRVDSYGKQVQVDQ